MKELQSFYVLSNGVKMPKIGFGTWQIKPGDEVYQSVLLALKHGYRHIDTAANYKNEAGVGKAIRDSGIPRNQIFVTSKLESHIKTYEGALAEFDKTLKELDLEYIDLYLIHAPWPWSEIGKDCREGNVLAFNALETIYRSGRARSIGVSNFDSNDLSNILAHCEMVPHVNQIPFFVGLDQKATMDFCHQKNIFVEAYSPLGIGYLLKNNDIQEIAQKNQVTPAQLCIRYCLDKGTAPLPKSIHESRIIENTKVDFSIPEDDMKRLESIKGDPRRWGN